MFCPLDLMHYCQNSACKADYCSRMHMQHFTNNGTKPVDMDSDAILMEAVRVMNALNKMIPVERRNSHEYANLAMAMLAVNDRAAHVHAKRHGLI